MGSGQLGNQPSDAPLSGGAIEDASLSDAELASNSVITSKIADSNVTTNKIANLNVTTGKLAVGAVTGDKMSVVDEYSVATQYGPFASPTSTTTFSQALPNITLPTSTTGQLTVASAYFEVYISATSSASARFNITVNGHTVTEDAYRSSPYNSWIAIQALTGSVRTNSTVHNVYMVMSVTNATVYFRNLSFNYSWFN